MYTAVFDTGWAYDEYGYHPQLWDDVPLSGNFEIRDITIADNVPPIPNMYIVKVTVGTAEELDMINAHPDYAEVPGSRREIESINDA